MISDYFNQGIWKGIESIQDPGLKLRAGFLPTLIHSRWAESTKQKYENAWEKWESWCKRYPESVAIPGSPFFVALYINDLVLEDCKVGTLDAAAAGIRYGHVIAGLPNPMEHIFVKTALEGAKRIVGKNTVKRQKEPVTSDMVKAIVDIYERSANLIHQRFVIACLLGFAGFLRISELLEIHVGDITFDKECMKIVIPKSKNDQDREGHVVYISRTETDYCTVSKVEKYLEKCNLANNPNAFIICRLAKTKVGHNPIGHRSICYTTINENFHEFIVPVCNDFSSSEYGLHSLRSGGSSAAINGGISERLVGKHGRWKSGYSRDRYLKDDKKNRLSVTKAINL